MFSLNFYNMSEIMNQLEKENEASEEVETTDSYRQAMEILKTSRDEDFKIKARLGYEKLVKQKLYTHGSIQFKFSNNIVLIANFALQEKVSDLTAFLLSHLECNVLEDKKLKIVMTAGYPPKKLTNMNSTVQEERLFPSALIYVIIEDEKSVPVDPPIKKESINELLKVLDNYDMTNSNSILNNSDSSQQEIVKKRLDAMKNKFKENLEKKK